MGVCPRFVGRIGPKTPSEIGFMLELLPYHAARSRGLAILVFLSTFECPPLHAKDLNVLTRVLYAAFYVEQGAAMCSVPAVQLIENDRVLYADTKNYAQWIKQRVSEGLSSDDAATVLKAAADRARAEMDEVVKVLKSFPPGQEYPALSQWCRTKMRDAATRVLASYEQDRAKVDDIIDNAKKD